MYPYIDISPSFQIPTYLVFLSLLYCFLIYWTVRRTEAKDIPQKETLDLGFALMVGGFLGARLLHVFFENPEYYLADPKKVFYIWEGGFVFYGGALGALLASLLVLKIQKLSFATWADFYAPQFALGYGLGRISCFLAGCCFGKSLDSFWAIEGRHPTQLYAVFFELAVYVFLIRFEKQKLKSRFPGEIFTLWVFCHSIGRITMEFFRDDFRGSLILNLSISTWISLILMGGSLAYYLNRKLLSK